MSLVLQFAGAVLVLTAFVLVQRGRVEATSTVSLSLNLVGAGLLAVLAALGRDWGFFLLEGAWAMVSAHSMRRA